MSLPNAVVIASGILAFAIIISLGDIGPAIKKLAEAIKDRPLP